jgi:hypothetical protein
MDPAPHKFTAFFAMENKCSWIKSLWNAMNFQQINVFSTQISWLGNEINQPSTIEFQILIYLNFPIKINMFTSKQKM